MYTFQHRSNIWFWLQCHWCSVKKLSFPILLKLQAHISNLFPLSVDCSTVISFPLGNPGIMLGDVRGGHPPKLRIKTFGVKCSYLLSGKSVFKGKQTTSIISIKLEKNNKASMYLTKLESSRMNMLSFSQSEESVTSDFDGRNIWLVKPSTSDLWCSFAYNLLIYMMITNIPQACSYCN